MKTYWGRPVFAPEDGGGAAAAAGTTAATATTTTAAAGAGATADAGTTAAQTPAAYRPDGLPDHLYGASDKETLDKLSGAYKGAREAISKFGEVPKDVGGYKFEASETVKPYATAILEGKDPFFEQVKVAALDAQISAPAFNKFLNEVMGKMIAGDMVADPFSADKERELLVPDVKDPAERAQKADAIVRENKALLDAFKAQGMPEAVHTWFASQLDRAHANQALTWLAGRAGETAPALGGVQAGGVTEATLGARMADPRNMSGGPKYDKAYAAETDRLYRQFYGD